MSSLNLYGYVGLDRVEITGWSMDSDNREWSHVLYSDGSMREVLTSQVREDLPKY